MSDVPSPSNFVLYPCVDRPPMRPVRTARLTRARAAGRILRYYVGNHGVHD